MSDIHADLHARPVSAAQPAFHDPVVQFIAAAWFGAFVVPVVALLVVGFEPVAIAVSLAAYLGAATLSVGLMRRGYPHPTMGLCNVTTLARLVLTAALVAPVMAPFGEWAVLIVAVPALGLDGIDGWLAHRQGRVSDFGARFDVEVDAAFALVLALNAWATGAAGVAVLILALPRYAFMALAGRWTWLARPLPQRFSRKVVCVLQIGTLIGLQVPGLPDPIATTSVFVAAGALCWSFGRDVLWLWHARR